MKKRRFNAGLALVVLTLLVALLFRMWGLAADLPYIYPSDEPRYVIISQNMFKTGDLNPHFFNYPSLFLYLNALAYVPYYFVGKLLHVFHTPDDILPPIYLVPGTAQAPLPTTVLMGRLITVCFGVGAVGMVYLAGKQLAGKAAVGILAALMVAVSPTNIMQSRMIAPNTLVVFFAAASFLASVLVYQQGKTWQYVMAGVCAGLTASSKYNGALILIALLLAHLFRHGKGALKQRNLYLALTLCGLAFLAVTPFALLDSTKFLTDLRWDAQHYATGHPGKEGNVLRWYLSYMWTTSGVAYALAVPGLAHGLRAHRKEIILLAAFPLIYFVFINSFVVRNEQTLLPLTPFLFLLTAWLLVNGAEAIRAMPAKPLRGLLAAVLAILVLVELAQPVAVSIADARRRVTINSRETARVWIADNLPRGSKIAIEAYSPFIDPTQFSVVAINPMIRYDPKWYVENGYEYLVLSTGMYGRFFREPDRYATEISQYNVLFERFTPVRIFVDGGYEIRIYRVDRPTSRLANALCMARPQPFYSGSQR